MICHRTLRTIIILLVVLFFCNATAIPSDNPEVVIPSVTKKDVGEKLLDSANTKGWIIKSASDFLIVIEKPLKGLGACLLFGSKLTLPPLKEYSIS